MSISLYSKGHSTRDYQHWKAWTFYFLAISHVWGNGPTPGPEIAIEDHVKKWIFTDFQLIKISEIAKFPQKQS
jgi:hypothetical protein